MDSFLINRLNSIKTVFVVLWVQFVSIKECVVITPLQKS